MPVSRLQLDECDDTGAYYYLTFKRNPKEKHLSKFLDEDGKLSAFKMLQALKEIIKQEVKNIESKYEHKLHLGVLKSQLHCAYALPC